MDVPNDVLYQAASVWKKLTEYCYVFTYGYKKQLRTINLTFSMGDFPHLAGFQYLKDLSLPRYNASKIVDKIHEHKITYEQVSKVPTSVTKYILTMFFYIILTNRILKNV